MSRQKRISFILENRMCIMCVYELAFENALFTFAPMFLYSM